MFKVTRLDGSIMLINKQHVKYIQLDEAGHYVVYMTTNKGEICQHTVKESLAQLVKLIK